MRFYDYWLIIASALPAHPSNGLGLPVDTKGRMQFRVEADSVLRPFSLWPDDTVLKDVARLSLYHIILRLGSAGLPPRHKAIDGT